MVAFGPKRPLGAEPVDADSDSDESETETDPPEVLGLDARPVRIPAVPTTA
jgi:hypothetical protein